MADDKCPGKKFPVEATCSLCLGHFVDPVTLDCEHVFCHICILKCWKESPSEASCPKCQKAAPQLSSPEDQCLDLLVQLLKQLSTRVEETAGKGEVCETHPALPEFICENKHAVSLGCDTYMEYQAEAMTPVEKDAQKLKDLFFYHLKVLRKEKGDILVHWLDMEKEGRSLVKQIEMEQEKRDAEFKLLHQFLREQENHLLCRAEALKEEIEWNWKEQTDKLSRQFSSLEKMIVELEEKCEQPASELLKDAGTILERVATKEFESEVVFPPLLKWELWEMCDLHAVLVSAVQKFKDTMNSGRLLKKANVTLDPDTAHPKLILSVDRKTLRLGDIPRNLNNGWKRFDRCFFALGCEEFVAGRHYWDVIVGNEDGWAVGVARKSVQRKGIFSLQPADGVWAMAKWGDRCMVLIPPYFPSSTVSYEFTKIRVSLNYAGRTLAFFDADTGALIWAFTKTEFSGEPLCPFFWLQRKIQLSLSP